MDSISVPQTPVTVSLQDLRKDSVTFDTLEQAFGPSSLGILLVSDLPPSFIQLRHKLLSYASYLANLPESELDSLSCPEAKYLVGWSCGKETLKSGHYDTLKGSYYVNCAFYHDPSLESAPADDFPSFPEYTAANVWPAERVLAGFRETFEALCRVIIDTAVLVARACDRYAGVHVEGYEDGYLERVVRTSLTTKARLLHYFPCPATDGGGAQDVTEAKDGNDDDWCATHVDHGCLTGLTSAMYVDEFANPPFLPPSTSEQKQQQQQHPPLLPELPSSPSPTAGLYIHSRTSAITKVNIPRTSLAFQTGEALQVVTKDKFRAVPHFVRAGGRTRSSAERIARNTLAVFTQPNLGEMVDVQRGLRFGDFAREVVGRNV